MSSQSGRHRSVTDRPIIVLTDDSPFIVHLPVLYNPPSRPSITPDHLQGRHAPALCHPFLSILQTHTIPAEHMLRPGPQAWR